MSPFKVSCFGTMIDFGGGFQSQGLTDTQPERASKVQSRPLKINFLIDRGFLRDRSKKGRGGRKIALSWGHEKRKIRQRINRP